MLVDETARVMKIPNAIAAVEKGQFEGIFYPYRPHRSHLTTRFGLLFYNANFFLSRTRCRHPSLRCFIKDIFKQQKWTNQLKHFGGPACIVKYEKKRTTVPAADPQVRPSKHNYYLRKKARNVVRIDPRNSIGLRWSKKSKDPRRCVYSSSRRPI